MGRIWEKGHHSHPRKRTSSLSNSQAPWHGKSTTQNGFTSNANSQKPSQIPKVLTFGQDILTIGQEITVKVYPAHLRPDSRVRTSARVMDITTMGITPPPENLSSIGAEKTTHQPATKSRSFWLTAPTKKTPKTDGKDQTSGKVRASLHDGPLQKTKALRIASKGK